jgi:hypothetical protein
MLARSSDLINRRAVFISLRKSVSDDVSVCEEGGLHSARSRSRDLPTPSADYAFPTSGVL